ncbi:E3 ubiquitin-protein ligase RNF216-like [Heteronotia binoei]|uniref:E3 ubiquitin-protein ligase RNF216-like n=1 Tax=Heteronotia binoei TaxID=13085 RepID=UPI002931F6AC|nr:E3 ubiquitin-protein ligase RNF216-like [Heteronotia binoei]
MWVTCPNPGCEKTTCRKCRGLWEEHKDMTCDELAEKDNVKYRTSIEEKMTAALVQKCPNCAVSVMKMDGCNHLFCRCGAEFCHLCRGAAKGYDHFCMIHCTTGPRCRVCGKCSLWMDPTVGGS